MRISTRGGNSRIKNAYLKKESLHRGLSLLLSLCMVVSLFGCVISFPAFAQEISMEIDPSKPEDAEGETREDILQETGEDIPEETREEVKARLLRQIREEGWDPYSSDMSLDEFYALMEMFQEGTLPLDEAPLTEEISAVDQDMDESGTAKSNTEESGTEEPGTGDFDDNNSDTGEPNAEEPGTGDFDVNNSDTGEPNTEEPGTGDFDVNNSDTGEPNAGEPGTGDFDVNNSDTGEPNAGEPGIGDFDAEDSNTGDSDASVPVAAGLNDSGMETHEDAVYIPRTMFLFSGLNPDGTTDDEGKDISSSPGTDVNGESYGSPLHYDNENGHTDEDDYKAGLVPDGDDSVYTRPPKEWKGVVTNAENDMKATVIVPDINKNDPSTASNVDQDLFLNYDGQYVYQVTAQNNDVLILGTIWLELSETYLYYYTNYDNQQTTVSVTTLPEGEKFVIRYVPREHTIQYKVLLAGKEDDLTGESGDAVTMQDLLSWIDGRLENGSEDWNQGNTTADIIDYTDRYKEEIFGTYLPEQSDLGAYAFTAKTLDGYTLSFYMVTRDDETGVWGESALKLSTKLEREAWKKAYGELTDEDEEEKAARALYTEVNSGWALGEEPSYTVYDENKYGGFKIASNLDKCPEYLTLNGTFYNNTLDADRIVIAVLRKKHTPQFNAKTIIEYSEGASNRGTSAVFEITAKNKETDKDETIPYDYEDVYLWAKDLERDSIYDYYENNLGGTTASKGNLQDGNIATTDNWSWQNNKDNLIRNMWRQPDGTYSIQWTFQTNTGDDFLLDALEINREGIQIPFYTKYLHNGRTDIHGEYRGKDSEGNDRDNKDDTTGLYAWSTTTTLRDGAEATVEFLMIFHPDGDPQRVYRVTVTGARNDVTITALNLMQYRSGAPEFSTYDLDGITGATTDDGSDLRLAAIQYYGQRNRKGWGSAAEPEYSTADNVPRGNVVVDERNDNNPDGSYKGIDYGDGQGNYGIAGGDPENGGANLRFKLAEGYANPYYLYESARDGVIYGGLSPEDRQASVERDVNTGEVIRSTRNDVVPYISNGDDPYMAYYIEDEQTGKIEFIHPLDVNFSKDDYADFVNAKPIPVTSDDRLLYDVNGNLYTDWAMIQIHVTDNGGTTTETLYPELYDSAGAKLTIKDVIVDIGGYTFKEKDRLMKSQYIYRGASNHPDDPQDDKYWYYIRVTGQGRWDKENGVYPDPRGDNKGGFGYRMALLTIVAYPMRYMVRYKPGTLPDYDGDGGHIDGGRPPTNMPTWSHDHDGLEDDGENGLNDQDCPAFPSGHIHDPAKPHEEFEDDEGNFYNVESNYDIGIVPTKPVDPLGYFEFQGWKLVDENDDDVFVHDLDEAGRWKTKTVVDDDGNETEEYVWKRVIFRSGSFDLRQYTDYAIENGTLGGDNNDIYVLRLMPVWQGLDWPYRYNVALNWVDVEGKAHTEYFSDYWNEIVTSFSPGEDNNRLVVKVLTESGPLRDWLAQNGTYAFWDNVNNAEEEDTIKDALIAYYKARVSTYVEMKEAGANDEAIVLEIEKDQEFKEALEALKQKHGKDGTKDEFKRLDSYTYEILEDGGTIVIWMQEIFGGVEFHKEVEAEPFIIDDEYYFTVEGDPNVLENDKIYLAYPDKEDVQAKEGWEVKFRDGKIYNIKQYDDMVAWPDDENRVTYFTLQGGEGITLYVPEGEYAVYELGSKSGGSYRAEVKYEDKTDNGNNAGKDWNISQPGAGGDLWLKGSETTHQDNNNETVSQLFAKGKVMTGAVNMVRTINFYNQTSTVAFEKTVAGPYSEGDRFGFEVTLELSAGTSPLRDESKSKYNGNDGKDYYYFNVNLYNVKYDEKIGETPQDDQPAGTPKAVATGRMMVKQDLNDPTTWVSTNLLFEKRIWYNNDGWQDTWMEVHDDGGVWIEAGQRLYVVCTVLQQSGDINYSIRETDLNGYRVVGEDIKKGSVKPAELAYERFVNSMLMVFPSTGGSGGGAFLVSRIMFLLSVMVFLLSGLGLAWLNRDLMGKRRRRV